MLAWARVEPRPLVAELPGRLFESLEELSAPAGVPRLGHHVHALDLAGPVAEVLDASAADGVAGLVEADQEDAPRRARAPGGPALGISGPSRTTPV